LETVARHFRPHHQRPALEVPVAHIAALVELDARDFLQTFAEKVPLGKTVTLGLLLWWMEKGELGWHVGAYLWQLNRIGRMLLRPATALVQELQDHVGQNLATKSVDGLKLWAIDYCVTKAGDYAIQLYSGGFVLDDEYRPRISARVEAIPFEQEPLQILVVGQVKSGKSSLINALLGEMRAPVDTLPATDDVDLYECQPVGLPRIILRDTPGYGASPDPRDPFSQLSTEIEESDLLLMVCTARSAARQADRELLHKVHEYYGRDPKRIMPPIIYVLTHVDVLPDHLAAEAAGAVAADLGITAGQVVPMCAEWGRLANLAGVVAVIGQRLPEAQRLKTSRCIRQIRKEQDEDKVLRQILNGLRLTGGWIAGKR
jgi:GTP-binding protein EngB required for normal cell division